MVICFNSLRINIRLVVLLFVISTILMAPLCICEAFGQGPTQSDASAPNVENPDQVYAPLGQSGYKVPLPEIKMNQILGGPSKSKPAQPEADESTAPQPETAKPPEKSEPEQPDQEETSVAPGPPRLPFGHPVLKRGPGAIPEKTRSEEPPPPLSRERVFPLAAPVAPEDPMVARPPKKEMIGKRIPPAAPPLLEAQPSKEMIKTFPLKAQEAPVSGPVERIPLGTRGEPEMTQGLKPHPAALPSEEKNPVAVEQSTPKETTPFGPSLEPEPGKYAPKEIAPFTPPAGPAHEPSIIKESLPSHDRSFPPPKEVLRSPLDQETPDTPEIKYYLRDTAPILEELSLLMTRAPSITIADYDPSDANAPLFPKDLQLKMDSMKRDLQILDSKTFAIIPPKRYEQFHGLIRDSITQTHLACDAIINYIAEPNEENFKTIQDHLFRARELIQKTRSHG